MTGPRIDDTTEVRVKVSDDVFDAAGKMGVVTRVVKEYLSPGGKLVTEIETGTGVVLVARTIHDPQGRLMTLGPAVKG